jgi:hypothetical protein
MITRAPKDVEKGNPCTLFMEIISIAIMENSMVIPQKVNNATTMRSASHDWIYI